MKVTSVVKDKNTAGLNDILADIESFVKNEQKVAQLIDLEFNEKRKISIDESMLNQIDEKGTVEKSDAKIQRV